MGSGLGCSGELRDKTQAQGRQPRKGLPATEVPEREKEAEEDCSHPLTFVALVTTDGIVQRVGILSMGTRTVPLLPLPKGRDQSSDP